MNDFSTLKSKNEYVNYTINNFVNCYDVLNENDLQLLTGLFSSLKDHTFANDNYLTDSRVLNGVMLKKEEERKFWRDTSDLAKQLEVMGENLSPSNKKDILFFQSLTHLCNALTYLDTMEMIQINDFFVGIKIHNQKLNEPIPTDDNNFFPYDRYPKQYSK